MASFSNLVDNTLASRSLGSSSAAAGVAGAASRRKDFAKGSHHDNGRLVLRATLTTTNSGCNASFCVTV
jgi:hypothetical protein